MILRKRYKSIKPKSGETMIEVLVAFMVVMIMVSMFGKVVNLSASFLQRSQKIIARTQSFDEEYYKISPNGSSSSFDDSVFTMEVDTVKSDAANRAKEASLTLEKAGLQKYTDRETGLTRYVVTTDTSTEDVVTEE